MLATLIAVGTFCPTYHYIRSNQDGSMPENIVVRRQSPTRIEIFKFVRRGTRSALVECEMSPDLRAPKALTSWMLDGNARKLIATLTAFAEHGYAHVKVVPSGQPKEAMLVPSRWHIFNMDLGSLMLSLAHVPRSPVEFSFIEPNPAGVNPAMVVLGKVTARLEGFDQRGTYRCRRWSLTGDALKGGAGTVWMAEPGFIVEARLPIPNHDGYRDFNLQLKAVRQTTSTEWSDFIRRTVSRSRG